MSPQPQPGILYHLGNKVCLSHTTSWWSFSHYTNAQLSLILAQTQETWKPSNCPQDSKQCFPRLSPCDIYHSAFRSLGNDLILLSTYAGAYHRDGKESSMFFFFCNLSVREGWITVCVTTYLKLSTKGIKQNFWRRNLAKGS